MTTYLKFLILTICLSQVQTDNTTLKFTCNSGQNIPMVRLCDAFIDCDDNSDENIAVCSNMRCPKNKYRCRNGGCIPQSARCDSKFDCLDKSDESQCGITTKKCGKSEYLCLSGECIENSLLCNGYSNCFCGSDEYPDICEKRAYSLRNFRCLYGGFIDKSNVCDGQKDCADASDEDPDICDKYKSGSIKCELPKSNRVFVECQKDNDTVECGDLIDIGTIVWRYCNEFYIPSDNSLKPQEVYCQADGRWNNDLLQCTPDCGKRDELTDAIPLIIHGWTTEASLWPWHAVIYSQEEDNYTFICGGTLIAEQLIITAAHCVWETQSELLRIALGKTHSNYSRDLENGAIIRDVRSIIIQPIYQDATGEYDSDIAVLVLNEIVQFTIDIRPICIDWDTKYTDVHLKENSIGTIVGMGITEEDIISETLRGVNLYVKSYEHCRQNQQRDFKKYITYTTFCAGTDNVTGVCNGDSGGGLIFPYGANRGWTIQGIVSVSARKRGTNFCDPNYYTVFTKIASFLPWLKQIIYDNMSKSVVEFPK